MNKIARLLLENKIIVSVDGEPVKFKSGVFAPVYTDNRKLSSYPHAWKKVIITLATFIKKKKIKFDLIAGVESAAIPHSAALGFFLMKPSVFVRKKTKAHGLKKMVEGVTVKGKRVLLIEDTISTGGSSIEGIKALRKEGAIVTDCVSIVNYNFQEVEPNFKKAKVKIHSLVPFTDVIAEAIKMKYFSKEKGEEIYKWLKNPYEYYRKIQH